jgi:hypothetical protein
VRQRRTQVRFLYRLSDWFGIGRRAETGAEGALVTRGSAAVNCPHLQTDMFGRCENCFIMLTEWHPKDLEQVTLIRRETRPRQPETEPKKLVG